MLDKKKLKNIFINFPNNEPNMGLGLLTTNDEFSTVVWIRKKSTRFGFVNDS